MFRLLILRPKWIVPIVGLLFFWLARSDWLTGSHLWQKALLKGFLLVAVTLIFLIACQLAFTNYRNNTLQNSDRNDYLNSVGVSLAYYFNQYCSLRAFFNYNAKRSDDPNANAYYETDGGVGGSLNLAF